MTLINYDIYINYDTDLQYYYFLLSKLCFLCILLRKVIEKLFKFVERKIKLISQNHSLSVNNGSFEKQKCCKSVLLTSKNIK